MWLTWPKETSETEGRDLQIHQIIVETWDDSDSITAVNAQKIWDMLQKWWHNHLEAQYQGSEANYEYTGVVGTELKIRTVNPTILRISNT